MKGTVIDGAFKKAASKIAAQANGGADWRSLLLQSKNGPFACEANVVTALRHAPELAGRLRFNELTIAAECEDLPWSPGEGWRTWADSDDTQLAVWCQREEVMVKPATAAVAAQMVALDRKCHPVRKYLNGLTWDGKNPLLDSWLHVYLGVKVEEVAEDATDTDRAAAEAKNTYVKQAGRKWLLSAVARAYRPGCQADHALILEGPQGRGKSSALAALMPDPAWFADDIADLGTKDSAQDLAGKWLIELGELSAMRRPEVERVKAFVSRKIDHYRPSYGRRSQDFPRQGIFGGTTNGDAYLTDETGNRRFWPVRVGTIDLAGLRKARDQIWAEAVAAYKAGESWWLSPEVEAAAGAQQSERRVVDPWEERLLEWAARLAEPVGIPEALEALDVPVERHDQNASNRVARIFKAAGWEKVQIRREGRRPWVYRRPPSPEASQVPSQVGDDQTCDEKASNSAAVTGVLGCFLTHVEAEHHTPANGRVEGDVPHRFGESGRDTRDTCDTRRNAGFSVLGPDRQTCDSTCASPAERPFDGCSDVPDPADDDVLDPTVPVTL